MYKEPEFSLMGRELRKLYIYMLKCDAVVTSVVKEGEEYVINLEARKFIQQAYLSEYEYPGWQSRIRLVPCGRYGKWI